MKIGITERGDAGLDLSWLKAKVDGVVAITKAPQNLVEISLPDNVVVHCTITGLGATPIEPNVASTAITLPAYYELVEKYGSERVVLRVDPILPIEPWVHNAIDVIECARGRVRISFIDAYRHTRSRLATVGVSLPWTGLHADLSVRIKLWEIFGRPEVCAEPGMVECTGCISPRDVAAMGLDVSRLSGHTCSQRQLCRCVAEKTEVLTQRGRCPHGCLYCYWK